MSNLSIIVLSIFVSLVLSLTTGYFWIRFAKRIKLVHIPFQSKHNINPVHAPLAGGFILLTGIIPSLILAAFLINNYEQTMFIVKLLVPLLIIFIFGILDDLKGLNAAIKFLGQLLAVSVFILMGNSASIFEIRWLDIFITTFWLVGITNAFNLIDSREGIVSGISLITAIILFFASIFSDQNLVTVMSAAVIGSCIGTFFYNKKPGKTFLGDSGAQVLGFLLASIAIVYNPIGYDQAVSWFLPILLFAIPIFDTCFVVFVRLSQRKNPFKGDINHTFHRLSRILKNEDDAIQILIFSSLIIDILAFLLLELDMVWSNISFAVLILLGLLIAYYLNKKDPGVTSGLDV